MNLTRQLTAAPLRSGLVLLAVLNLLIGAYGVVSPHGFYRNVLGVDLLGPYNEHLLSDVGGFYLGFAAVFAWAARTLSVELIRAVCVGYGVTQVVHFLFHLTHLGAFSVGEAVVQTVGLAIILAAPVLCFALSSKLRR